MKQTIIAVLFATGFYNVGAQNVLIGSGSVNSKAMMEVRSTEKGMLIPRLSTTQRTAIPSPAAGLLVFDSTRNDLYGYDGSAWRYFLDNDFWRMSGADLYNLSDSIGIGTSSPDEKLHVNGTLRTSDGDLQFNEISGTASKLISDYNGGGGNGYIHSLNFYDGTVRRGFLQYAKFDDPLENRIDFGVPSTLFSIQTDGVSTFTAPDGTLQLQSGGVDKGFVQLAGNDLRMGTNSSNSDGRFIIRSGAADRFFVDGQGRVGIGSTPFSGYALNVQGALKGSGNLTANSGNITVSNVEIATEVNNTAKSGTANLVPVYYGRVTAAGACTCSSSGAAVSHPFYGNYVLSYPGMSSSDIVMVSINQIGYRAYATLGGLGANYPGFLITPVSDSYSGPSTADVDFSFMVFKQ
ncbi:MAG: hypothetical protein H7Y86_10765 [Rhizobacter sp.]|nr:hypothetical protein [Ferruginibacter sp.]